MKVYSFTHEHDDDVDLKALIGGKGAGLNKMTQLGLPVPPGFSITCDSSLKHTASHKHLKPSIKKGTEKNLAALESEIGRNLGDSSNPLLLSVRSGAPISMPGMMETVLNLGLNDETVEGLAQRFDPQFAWDSYRRFVHMYATIVLHIDDALFKNFYNSACAYVGTEGKQLPAELSEVLVEKYKKLIVEHSGSELPQDPMEQLENAILAVFRSWRNSKAKSYRKIEGIPFELGTGVNVQAMVFGNLNEQSGTGVMFTRNPNTGENVPYGDFLINAQGEDVVDGSHDTLAISDMQNSEFSPQYDELMTHASTLEHHYKDMCDIEFTVEDGKLWILQTRIGKRLDRADGVIALDMMESGLLSAEDATPRLHKLLEGNDDDAAVQNNFGAVIGTGKPATPISVTGRAVFSSKKAQAWHKKGEDVILIRPETTPDDTEGMAASCGIITNTGGLVSHAAVVARPWNKACIVGVGNIKFTHDGALFDNVVNVKEGDVLTINGKTGEVIYG